MAFITNAGGQLSTILFPISASSLPSATAVQIEELPKGSVIHRIDFLMSTADAANVSVGTVGTATAFSPATTLTAGLSAASPTGAQAAQWLAGSAGGDVMLYAKASAAVTTGVGAILITYRFPTV